MISRAISSTHFLTPNNGLYEFCGVFGYFPPFKPEVQSEVTMTQDNIPKDFHERTNRIEEGVSDDELELVEVLENTMEEILEHGDTDEEAEQDMDDSLFSYDPPRDDSIYSYFLHRGSAFACDINPDGKLIASGGEDDRFIITEFPSGNNVLDCDNYFQDSVIMVGFNHDGKYVSACDMLGNLGVWKIAPTGSTVTCVFMETVGSLTPSSWAKWHPKSNVLLIGGQSVWLYKIPNGQCKIIHDGTMDTDAGNFMPDGKRAVIGFEDGTVKVVDLATGATTCKFSTESTELGNILSIAVHPDNNLIVAGSMNAKLALFKTQPPKTVGVLDCSETAAPVDGNDSDLPSYSIEVALFVSLEGYDALVVGTDFAIHIWDYSRLVVRHKIVIEEGVTRMLWLENSRNLYVGTRIGSINVYDPVSGEARPSLEGHRCGIMELTFSSDKKHLVTASDDGVIKVFKIGE